MHIGLPRLSADEDASLDSKLGEWRCRERRGAWLETNAPVESSAPSSPNIDDKMNVFMMTLQQEEDD